MLTYSFENIGSESLYIHLYGRIKSDIISGRIAAGFKLPSKRSFAKNLGISTITVENAYAKLISEGYVYSIAKKGYFVAETADTPLSRGGRMSAPRREKMRYFADFVSNNTPSALFPFATWARLMRGVISEGGEDIMTAPPSGGIPELREAVSKHLYEYRGMNVSPDCIIIGAGTEYLYGLIIQLLGRNITVALENPGYGKIAKIYRANGVKTRHIPLDDKGADIGALRAGDANTLHISPSHHFPTGIVTPISRRYELLAWASENDKRFIIEDDYDSELGFAGKPIPTLQSIDAAGKVIYVNTFTKTLAPSLRISYMVLPPTLADKYYDKLGFYACTVSVFEQRTLTEFINGGHFSRHINRMRKYYRGVRDALVECIRESPVFCKSEISAENAGLHFMLRLPTEKSDERFMSEARETGINIACLTRFSEGGADIKPHMAVLNYSGIDVNCAKEAIHRLGKCCG